MIFGQNYDFWAKLWFLAKTMIFGRNNNFWAKLWFLAKTMIFGQNYDFWAKLWFLTKKLTKITLSDEKYDFGKNVFLINGFFNWNYLQEILMFDQTFEIIAQNFNYSKFF